MLKYTYQDETRKDNVIPTMKEDGHTIVIPAFTINGHKVPEMEMDIDPANDNRARVYVRQPPQEELLRLQLQDDGL